MKTNKMDLEEINIPKNCSYFSEDEDAEYLSEVQIDNIVSNTPFLTKIKEEPTLIVINDHHRSTPSYKILSAIAKIRQHNIKEIIIACGTHPPPSNDELHELIRGTDKLLNAPVKIHDGIKSEFDYYGRTKSGTEVKLNTILKNYQHILVINSVEPHFFAGYTGGIKSIVPGLAAKETVVQNHSWAMDPNSIVTSIKNNPLQADLWEAYGFYEETGVQISAIQLVNISDEIVSIDCGSLRDAFFKAISSASRVYVKEVETLFDIIVSYVKPPINRSLYQAQKGIENTRKALRKGGTMILVAKCHEGIGNDAFYETMLKFDNPKDVLLALSQDKYRFGDHKAVKFATLAEENTLYVVSSLSEDVLHHIFAKSMSMSQLNEFLQVASHTQKIAIVSNGGMITLNYSSF